MRKLCFLVHLISSVSFLLGSVGAQRPCPEDTLDNAIRNFIGRAYKSEVNRILGKTKIDTEAIDLFGSCVTRQRQFGLPENEFGINAAVVSFNIPGDYSTNSGDAGYTGRLDVKCWLGQWFLTRSNQEPYLREPEGVCAQCDTKAHVPCKPCLLSCESNEIPLDDCSDCGGSKLKTEIHTYSQPAWKDHVPASTSTTKKPDSQSQLQTELVGTTNVVTHGVNHPDVEQPTTEPGIETVKPTTKLYTTQTAKPTTKLYTTQAAKPTTKDSTTQEQHFTTKGIPPTKGYTTKVLPTGSPTAASTSPHNKITTKSINSTQARLLTIEKKTTEPIKTTKPAKETTDSATIFNTAMISPLYTGKFEVTTSDSPTTDMVTTENDVLTRKVTIETEIVTTKAEIVTTKAETVTTEATAATTITAEADPTEAPWGGDVDNEVDDSTNADPEYCVDRDKCYNGGESVCEKNGGDFLYCICQHGFTGTFCEQERSVAMVDDHEPRGNSSFWDWKLSKYIIGGLGALTVIGLIMLTCMVVKCVKSGKEDRRRMEEYNAVGLETFIPPAPVVQTTLMGAAMDRGSSDVMDERSEEEFHLHDSDEELGDGPVQVHRLHHHYPDPEDDGLLHHAPTHRPGPSPEHYKVPTPTQNREYMNMNGKQNGNSPYMNGHYSDNAKIGPYMNGSANTYSHKLNDKNTDQYAHLNRSFSKNAQPQHNYLNLP